VLVGGFTFRVIRTHVLTFRPFALYAMQGRLSTAASQPRFRAGLRTVLCRVRSRLPGPLRSLQRSHPLRTTPRSPPTDFPSRRTATSPSCRAASRNRVRGSTSLTSGRTWRGRQHSPSPIARRALSSRCSMPRFCSRTAPSETREVAKARTMLATDTRARTLTHTRSCSYSNAPMRQIYTCAGSVSGPEIYRTQFTYYGFRYIGITGCVASCASSTLPCMCYMNSNTLPCFLVQISGCSRRVYADRTLHSLRSAAGVMPLFKAFAI
jgi:hypothetical protein